jgi:hypothetical protein
VFYVKYQLIICVGVEDERSISQNKKKTAKIYLHLKSRVCHVFIIGKGWTGGLKISSRLTLGQPSVGRAFS